MRHNKCSIEGCGSPVWSKGLCKNHTGVSPLKRNPKSKNPDLEEAYTLMNFYDELWRDLKDKRCKSCNKKIVGENLSIYWHHCLPKELYPQFKFDKRNMLFVCGDCHASIENAFPSKKVWKYIENVKKALLNDNT